MIKRIQSSDGRTLFPRSAERSGRIKWLLAGIMAVIAVLGVAFACSNRREPLAPTEIFVGITYGCKQLDTTGEGSGLVHWVIVDLAAPGIELYVTPLDPDAVARGWQYHLRRIGDVVNKERLAVAINATLFESNSGWWPRMAGDLARGGETLVAEHVVSHLSVHTYFLWFDEQLTPHLRPSNPPTAAELSQAKMGHRRTRGWPLGRQGSAREQPYARFSHCCGRRPAAETIVSGGRPKYLAPPHASRACRSRGQGGDAPGWGWFELDGYWQGRYRGLGQSPVLACPALIAACAGLLALGRRRKAVASA